MKRLALILVALAMLWPILVLTLPSRAEEVRLNNSATPERHSPFLGLQGIATPPLRVLEQARTAQPLDQVRIERRVIIRISPSARETRQRVMAELSRRAAEPGFSEVPHEDCIAIDRIAGVASTRDNRLLLLMRDNRVLAASLDRSCSARGFYSGFYVERNEDGRLCVSRDQLRSRAGQSCELDSLSRLVAPGR